MAKPKILTDIGTLRTDLNTHKTDGVAHAATNISIADTGNYYTGTNTEAALQEIGQAFNGMKGSLLTSVNGLLGM